MIITLYSNTYKPFSHGYPKFIQVQRVHDPQQTGSPIHAISRVQLKEYQKGFDSVDDFDFDDRSWLTMPKANHCQTSPYYTIAISWILTPK